jgi:hypothetical protein
MTSFRHIAPLASVALATAAPASAQGVPPAQWPAEVRAYHAERVQDCRQVNNGRVTFNDADGPYVRAADFNGDERPDYLVDVHGIRCSSAATMFCAALGCDYTLFVSQPNGRYADAGGFMGNAQFIVQQGRPMLRVEGGQGVRLWGWNGREFAIVNPGAPGRTLGVAPASAPAGGYTIIVTFDAEATRRMTAGSHQMLVTAEYYGVPVPGHRGPTNEYGIDLGKDDVVVAGRSGSVVLSGAGLRRDQLRHVQGGRVMAVINVHADRAGMLNCGPVDAPLAALQARATPINCGWRR